MLLYAMACVAQPADTGSAVSDDGWILGPLRACADPHEGWTDRFSEEGAARGLVGVLPTVQEVLGFDSAGLGGDLTARDLDDDGDVDLLVGGMDGAPDLYLNDGTGHFTLFEGAARTPAPPGDAVSGMAVVDLDGDRFPEILKAGAGSFTVLRPADELTWSATLPDWIEDAADPMVIQTLAVGDANGDGWLDVALPSAGPASMGPDSDRYYGGPDRVLLADGEGGWRLAAELVVEGDGSRSQLAAFTDRDADGDADLYIVADRGPPSAFWRNDGVDDDGLVRWVDDAADIGADLVMAGMGIDAADLDGDGWLDYCMSDVGPPRCIVSDGAGGFVEEGLSRGLVPAEEVGIHGTVGWSIDLLDLDNDGWLDLVQAGGPEPGTYAKGYQFPDLLWAGRDGGQFEDVTAGSGFGTEANHVGLAAADVDGDGFLDLLVSGPGEAPQLYMNRCGAGAWLEVDLWGPPENTDGIGARVIVEAGGRRRTRELMALRSHGQGPTRLHFGLGGAERVDRVEVRWPDGTVQVLEDVEPRREVVAVHPRGVRRGETDWPVAAETSTGGVDLEPGPGEVAIHGYVFNAATGDPLPNVDAWSLADPDRVARTDQDGAYSLPVPADADVDVVAGSEAYVPLILPIQSGWQTSPQTGVVHPMTAAWQLDDIYDGFYGVTHEPGTGTLWVQPMGATGQPVDGAAVDIDLPYGEALVANTTSAAPGNVLTADAMMVVFANVAPGDASIDLQLPDGLACQGRLVVPVQADAITFVMLACS